jgi:hypothetical protein
MSSLSSSNEDSNDNIKQRILENNYHGKFSKLKINASEFLHECRSSRKLVLLVVFIALFFDNMLLTTIGNEKIII